VIEPDETGAVTVGMPEGWLRLLRVGCGLLGFGAGFAVDPLAEWLLDSVGSAPMPLRLAAQLPTPWAVLVLTAVGVGVGIWLAHGARRDSPVVIVGNEHVVVDQAGSGLHVPRGRVEAVFTDGRDLVVLDHDRGELVRVRATDLPTGELQAAFERFDYPWCGTTDPRDAGFVRWVDGAPDLDGAAHVLLRARKRALADGKPGAAEDALEQLRAMGIAVRDRDGVQQYHRRPAGSDG
jgi:hypothetical protein